MRVTATLVRGIASLAVAQMPLARAAEPADEAFLKAALVISTFDHFAAGCNNGAGFRDDDARRIEAWQAANGVAQIRLRLHELERHAARKQQIEQAVAKLAQQLAVRGVADCAAALRVTTTSEAQFAKVAPQLLSADAAATQLPPSSTAAPKAESAAASASVLASIDSFAFNTRQRMGVGGFLTTDVVPVVLFRNGEALTAVEGLGHPGGIAAHKRAKPAAWTRWRRSGGELQIFGKSGWEKLPFQTTYSKLPDGLRLSGRFRRLSGSGNVAVGGTDAVTAFSEYRFTADGQVQRGGAAGARAQAGNSGVVTQSTAPGRRGRYHIDGLTLHLRYDDGSSEQRILITDPKDPNRVLWLDGAGYVRRGD